MEQGRQVLLSLLPRAMEVSFPNILRILIKIDLICSLSILQVVSIVLRAVRGTSKIQTVVLVTMSALIDKSITSLAPMVLNIQLI